jgi:hypothetical protein
MKLPYRVGDTFTMPIGDGRLVEATIVAHDHHNVEIAVTDLVLRVSDRALVLHRWRRIKGSVGLPTTALRAYARDDRSTALIGPAHAERIVATHLGIANVELPPLHVHNRWEPRYPLNYARIAGRGRAFDPRELPPGIQALDCSGVALNSLEFPRTLHALRLAWISTPVDLRALEALSLQALSLEELRDVRGIDALTRMESLQQLEMLGFWQLALEDVMPLVASRNIVRAEIDIGGRRKNVELYKRANWAYPWPFEISAIV